MISFNVLWYFADNLHKHNNKTNFKNNQNVWKQIAKNMTMHTLNVLLNYEKSKKL